MSKQVIAMRSMVMAVAIAGVISLCCKDSGLASTTKRRPTPIISNTIETMLTAIQTAIVVAQRV